MNDTDLKNRRVHRAAEHVETEVDGEVVLMQFSSGAFFSMEDTARVVWREVEDGRTVQQIIERIAEVFSGEPAVIEADTVAFLRDLEANGLVRFE
jgi:hypothetical protein